MSTPFDSFAKLHEESAYRRQAFIKAELKLCFTLATIATRKYESAANSLANAEKAYATMMRLLSNPMHAKRLTGEQAQDVKAELKQLREKLDRLRSQR